MSLHDLRPSARGTYVAAGSTDGQVLVANCPAMRTSAYPCSAWDLGGARLAVSEDGGRLYTAGYHVHGLHSWHLLDGGIAEAWQRRDLKKVQSLTLSEDGGLLVASVEGRGTFLINTSDGSGRGHWRGVTFVCAGPNNRFMRAARRLELCDSAGNVFGTTGSTTFAVLSASFGASLVCISEAGGPVRFFSQADFREVWRYQPSAGSHVLRIAARLASTTFVGIEWPYKKGGDYRVLEFAPATGLTSELRRRPSTGEFAFCGGGEWLFLAPGLFEPLIGPLAHRPRAAV